MNLKLARTASNQLEIRFEDNDCFPRVKDLLMERWGAKEKKRLESINQVWLDLALNSIVLTLHWDDMAGVCLISPSSEGDSVLREIADRLG